MRFPSMQALRSLDGLARHGSMLKAARELNLTPSAISHQLRALEHELGEALVERNGRGVTLTPFGRHYTLKIQKALTIIQQAGNVSDGTELKGRLCVSCVPGFAIFWLCNHLAEFRRLYSRIDLEIVTPQRLDDVRDRQADMFVAFGTGNWPGMSSELLAEVQFTPYCSPALLAEFDGGVDVNRIAQLPLLHMGNYDDWTRWLAATGCLIDAQRGIKFANMYMVLSAAVSGLGIAIGDNLTCKAAVEQGQLVKPFSLFIRSLESYFLVSEEGTMDRPICKAFRDWLKAKLDAFNN